MGRKSKLYREYDEKTGELIKLECGKCHEIKTVDCFYECKSKKDGVRTECKQCNTEIKRQYRKNNPDCNRKYYRNNKEKINEINRQYYENNKEKINEKHSQYYKNHKEERHEYNLQYYKNKIQQELMEIYEKITKQLYPHKGIQYGVIYGVYNLITDRWYIGQTKNSFNVRYYGDFFKNKINELSEKNARRQLLADDIEKYGIESFETFKAIDVAFSKRELNEKEAYYIDLYKAYDEGYNSTRGNIFADYEEEEEMLL